MIIELSKYYAPKPKQKLAHKCRAKYLLFGGSMGGGKSMYLCGEAIKQAMKYNGNRLVIVRKELSVLRRTTLITFLAICPNEIIKSFNQTSLEVTFINGSVLTFLEANISKDPLLNKLKGLEIGWFGIDEANEVAVEVYQILKTRLRWVLPNGNKPSYEGRLTSNPENCWLIPIFINSTNSTEVYIQSLTTDNYDEDSEYVIQLKEAFKDSPNLLNKYLLGDWSLSDSINQLITSASIKLAESEVNIDSYVSLGVDVARYGSDKTVFTVLKNGNIVQTLSYSQTSTTDIVTKTIAIMHEYNIRPENVGIDAVGLGAGVVDGLKSLGYNVIEIIGGSKAIEQEIATSFNFFNLRSQMYWTLREDFIQNKLGNLTNEVLKEELSSIKYEIAYDKTLKVFPKETIKKMLGRSPDFADSLVYANWVKYSTMECFIPLNIYGGED